MSDDRYIVSGRERGRENLRDTRLNYILMQTYREVGIYIIISVTSPKNCKRIVYLRMNRKWIWARRDRVGMENTYYIARAVAHGHESC